MRDIGPAGLPWHPTSSVRTLYQPEADVFVKTSLSVRITNCVRHSSVADLEGAVLLTRLLGRSATEGFAVLGEPAARTIAVDELAGRVGAIVRSGLALAPGERAHLAGTLAAQEVDPAGTPTRLADVLAGGDPLAWWDAYVALLVPPGARLWAGKGVVLEPHLQNVLVVTGDNGAPVRVLLRDMEGVRLRTDRHAALLASLAPAVAAATAYDPDRAAARIGYCLLVNNLGELAVAVAELSGAPEERLWAPVRAAVAAVVAELDDPPSCATCLEARTLAGQGEPGGALARRRGPGGPVRAGAEPAGSMITHAVAAVARSAALCPPTSTTWTTSTPTWLRSPPRCAPDRAASRSTTRPRPIPTRVCSPPSPGTSTVWRWPAAASSRTCGGYWARRCRSRSAGPARPTRSWPRRCGTPIACTSRAATSCAGWGSRPGRPGCRCGSCCG